MLSFNSSAQNQFSDKEAFLILSFNANQHDALTCGYYHCLNYNIMFTTNKIKNTTSQLVNKFAYHQKHSLVY